MRRGRYTQAVLPLPSIRRRRRPGGTAGRLTITPSLLVSYQSNTDLNSYTTSGSFAPTANALCLLWLAQTGTNPTGPTSFSGPLTSFTLIDSFAVASLWFGFFRALSSSPGSGQLTMNFNAGEASTGLNIIITQYVGVKQGGTNGANAVLQPNKGNGAAITTIAVALAANLSHPNNYCAYGLQHNANEDAAVGSGGGFTQRGSPNFHSAPNLSLIAADKQNDKDDNPTWVTATTARWHAVEVVAG